MITRFNRSMLVLVFALIGSGHAVAAMSTLKDLENSTRQLGRDVRHMLRCKRTGKPCDPEVVQRLNQHKEAVIKNAKRAAKLAVPAAIAYASYRGYQNIRPIVPASFGDIGIGGHGTYSKKNKINTLGTKSAEGKITLPSPTHDVRVEQARKLDEVRRATKKAQKEAEEAKEKKEAQARWNRAALKFQNFEDQNSY